MPILILWLIYRIFTSFWAAILSAKFPASFLERALPLWPPNGNGIDWIARAFLQPWMRWDADWYVKIITSGYRADDGTAQFHPLYAWLAMPFYRLGIDPLLSLLIISSVAGILMLFLFEKLARLDLDSTTANIATILLISFPVAFILYAPYTESLFLLCTVGSLYFMRTRKWIMAGVLGGLAALTRQQGIFMVFPLAWELCEAAGRNLKSLTKTIQGWAAVIGPVAGLAVWFIYRAIFLNDFPGNPRNLSSLVYSGLISSSAVKVVPVYQFTWPWQALWLALYHLNYPDTDLVIDLILAVLFVLMLVLSWPRLRVSYRIYSIVIFLVGFSYYTGPVHPYMGLPRHLFLAFPVFFGIAPLLQTNRRWLVWMIAGLPIMLVLIAGYVSHAWVP